MQANLIEVSHALERCSWLVEDLGVVLMEFEQQDYAIFGDQLRRDSAKALAALADVLDTPDRAAPGNVLQRRRTTPSKPCSTRSRASSSTTG